MTEKPNQNKRGSNRIWIIPVSLVVIVLVSIGGYFGFSYYSQQQAAIESSQLASSEQADIERMRQILDQDIFFAGIFIDDIDLAGKTYDEIETELQSRNQAWQDSFLTTIQVDAELYELSAKTIGIASNWQEILEQAWQIGRASTQTDEAGQIRERFAAVEALRTAPIHLAISSSYDEQVVRDAVLTLAKSLDLQPVNAVVAGFDLASKEFVITDAIVGRTIDGEACATEVLKIYAAGQSGQTVIATYQPIAPEIDQTVLKSKLGKVSEAVTKAVKVNVPRDSNISLICKMIDGLVLQPGETFSFNGYIGQRTAAKGFREAGGISGGILIQELGGGICQPNTTLCQAVLKADLKIVERHPHSWPSDYTSLGLDATVSWKGPDFKFTNNTDYPIAIVCYYSKPSIVFQVYGRLLDAGVSIKLDSVRTGTIPVTQAPSEVFNPELAPGARIEVRSAKTGQSATAYKIWIKDGKEIKREVAFTSVYKPLNQVFEYGPIVVPTETIPVPTETAPTETTPSSEATAPSETAAF